MPSARLRILAPAPDASPHGYYRYHAVTLDPPLRCVIVTNLSHHHLDPGRPVTAELAAVLPSGTLLYVVRVEDYPFPPWLPTPK